MRPFFSGDVPCGIGAGMPLGEEELYSIWFLVKKYHSSSGVFKHEPVEDLLQECLHHWLMTKGQFCEGKGAQLKTYLDRVIQRKLIDMLREKRVEQKVEGVSLEGIQDGLSEFVFEGLLKDEDKKFEEIGASELSERLHKASEDLSRRQKRLCRLLGEDKLSVLEASRQMGLPRRTVRDEMERIKEVFRKEGLDNFLRQS